MKNGNKIPMPGKENKVLRDLRKKAGLSQDAVAEKIGCDIRTYRNWEKYGETISTDYLVSLAGLFHVSTDYLLGRIKYTSVGNAEISEITGLTNESIEMLRYLHSEPRLEYNETANTNLASIDLINRVLEYSSQYMKYDSEGLPYPVFTLFSQIEEYILTDQMNTGQSVITVDVGKVPEILDVKALYAAAKRWEIETTLDQYRTREREGKYGKNSTPGGRNR